MTRKNPYVMRPHNGKTTHKKRGLGKPRKGISVTIDSDIYEKLMEIYEPNKKDINLSSHVENAIRHYIEYRRFI